MSFDVIANIAMGMHVDVSGREESSVNEDNKPTDSDAYFFAEVEKEIKSGSAAYFQVDLKPVSHTSEPGLKQ